jgi:hypothetical protein
MATGRGQIPGPYVETVKEDKGLMIYPPDETMDIGARRSGMPRDASRGPKSIDHVGGSSGSRGKEGK